jgi:hypothetical protein
MGTDENDYRHPEYNNAAKNIIGEVEGGKGGTEIIA